MKSLATTLLCMICLIPMLTHAGDVTEGAQRGLLLWYNSVVPALFPFMILSGWISANDGIARLMTPFYKILHPIYGLSKNGCYVLLSGLLCGCPMGAKTCAEFVRDGRLESQEARMLLAICNHASPMFILGYVYPLFCHALSARQLLICVYAPVIILGFAAKWLYFSRKAHTICHPSSHFQTPVPKKIIKISTDEMILSSVEVLCKIGGYLILFSILIVFLEHETRLPSALRLALIGSLEMTTSIQTLAHTLPTIPAFISSMAALTFGGFSGLFQTKSVLHIPNDNDFLNEKKTGLSIRSYFLWKLAHAGLSAALAMLLCTVQS